MRMLNPPYPGEFVKTEIIDPLGPTVAAMLCVSRPALATFLNGRSDASGTMALRIEEAFGVKMNALMRMQASFDIAREREGDIKVTRYGLAEPGNHAAPDTPYSAQ